MKTAPPSGNRRWIWLAVMVLFVLHHDWWWWSDRHLVFGFLPIGLAYHAVFSLAAALLWVTAIRFAWPAELEAWADETVAPEPQTPGTTVG